MVLQCRLDPCAHPIVLPYFRDEKKLRAARQEVARDVGDPSWDNDRQLPIIIATVSSGRDGTKGASEGKIESSLDAMCARATCIRNCVGPYRFFAIDNMNP